MVVPVIMPCVNALAAAPADSQVLTKVSDIRNNPRGYANEVVTLEGFATQWVEGKVSTTRFYFLKDGWGGVIKVRTSKAQPEVGERYRVTGPIGIDPTNHNDLNVNEETRADVRHESPFISISKVVVLVSANVGGATIEVDGSAVGQTGGADGSLLINVSPGRHTIRLFADGYQADDRLVEFSPGPVVEVSFELKRALVSIKRPSHAKEDPAEDR